jgi:hypothetical protein
MLFAALSLVLLPTITLAKPIALTKHSGPSLPLPVEVIHEFPNGTWIENLVVRPSGSILANAFSIPVIYEVTIDQNPHVNTIHTFPNATGVSGIAESWSPNLYFAVAGNFSFANFSSIPGSSTIYRIEFDEHTDEAEVTGLARLPTLIMPNGIITIPRTPYVLITDSIAGIIYRFDTETNDLTTYLDHPLLKPSGTFLQTGVNGIKLSRQHLYFSNTDQELIARVPVSGWNAKPHGEPEIVASQTLADDFIVNDENGDVFIAENGDNELGFLSHNTYGNASVPETLVGSVNSTVLAGPTAARWAKGEEGRTLIVTTTGGLLGYLAGGTHVVGGRINRIDVDGIYLSPEN